MTIFSAVYRLLWILLITAALFAVPPAFGARQQSIRVVMDNNYPPYVFLDNTGKLQGILIDQWRLWEQKSGITVELHAMDWGKAISGMKAGKFDVIDTIFKTDERSGWLDFTRPYARLEVPIFFDKEISGITDAASLKGFAVAAKTGDAAVDFLKSNGVDSLLLFNSYEEIVLAAKEHKVTVFVVDKPPALYLLHKFGISEHYKQSAPLSTGEFHRAVKKGNLALLKSIEDGFENIPTAELKKIEAAWHGTPLENGQYRRYFMFASAGLGLLVLALFVSNRILRKMVNTRTAALLESRAFSENLLQTANVMIIGLDLSGKITVFNPAAERLTGYTRKELETLNWFETLTPRDRYPHVWEEYQRLAAGGTPKYFENQILTKSGEERFIAWSNNEVLESGRIIGTISFGLDVTERKLVEDALHKSEEEFRIHIENSFDVIFTLNAEATFVFVSNAWERHFGYPASDVIGKSFAPFVHPDDVAPCSEYLAQVLSTGQSGTSPPYRVRHADGSWRWFIANGSPYVNSTGALLYTGVAHDITEQRQADEALRENEERLRVIFETSDSGIILVTPQGVIDFANRRMAEMFGMPHQDLIGTSYPEHLHESEKRIGDKRMGMLIRGEIQSVSNERRYIRKDGTDFWGYLSGKRLENPDGSLRALVGVITDITELKRAEETLEASREKYRGLSDAGFEAIFFSEDGICIEQNKNAELMFGYSDLEAVGRHGTEWIAPEDRELVTQQMASGCEERYEVTALRKDGTTFPALIRAKMMPYKGKHIRVTSLSDISIRKKAEEDRLNLERQMLHSQKLESLGVLSGGIAHDFNNLLQALLGNLELALTRIPDNAAGRKNIDQAINAGKHAAKLTNMMLAYSGKGLFVVKPLNLSQMVEENATMLEAAISKTVLLDLQLDHDLPQIMADTGQIQQVIMNLITNASEAIGEQGGKIKLSTGVKKFDQATLNSSRLEEKPAAGRYVWMKICDSGCGMDQETLNRLFDPFFTTKFTGRGLGMSAVLGIIRAHKGAFLIESKPGIGTTIQVLFPVVDLREERAEPSAATAEIRAASRRGVVVLVVDDEEMIRSVSVAMLEELGLEAIAAATGEEALRLFREQGDRIGLVLLDQVMPGMDGVSIFKEMRRIRPDIKILLASGFSELEVAERFQGMELNGFIPKPFNLQHLKVELRRVLERSGDDA